MIDYKEKYLKYKAKYLALKEGGGGKKGLQELKDLLTNNKIEYENFIESKLFGKVAEQIKYKYTNPKYIIIYNLLKLKKIKDYIIFDQILNIEQKKSYNQVKGILDSDNIDTIKTNINEILTTIIQPRSNEKMNKMKSRKKPTQTIRQCHKVCEGTSFGSSCRSSCQNLQNPEYELYLKDFQYEEIRTKEIAKIIDEYK